MSPIAHTIEKQTPISAMEQPHVKHTMKKRKKKKKKRHSPKHEIPKIQIHSQIL